MPVSQSLEWWSSGQHVEQRVETGADAPTGKVAGVDPEVTSVPPQGCQEPVQPFVNLFDGLKVLVQDRLC